MTEYTWGLDYHADRSRLNHIVQLRVKELRERGRLAKGNGWEARVLTWLEAEHPKAHRLLKSFMKTQAAREQWVNGMDYH